MHAGALVPTRARLVKSCASELDGITGGEWHPTKLLFCPSRAQSSRVPLPARGVVDGDEMRILRPRVEPCRPLLPLKPQRAPERWIGLVGCHSRQASRNSASGSYREI